MENISRCSFCDKASSDVLVLIHNPEKNVFICDSCAKTACEAVEEFKTINLIHKVLKERDQK